MNAFSSLAAVLGLAAGGGILAKLFRQPALLGYILAGVLITALGWMNIPDVRHLVELMGQLGVTLLLFLVGLEMSIDELKHTGRAALITGLAQILFTGIVGYGIAKGLGVESVAAIYLSLALTFSSTIIVIKLLSEKRDLQSLYGKIAVGILLVQDFVAIGMLVMLSGLGQGEGLNLVNLGWVALKGVGLVVAALVLASRVLPRLMGVVGKSSELLFITALGWCLGVAALVASPWIGFGVEIGGFLAGLSLSTTVEHWQIAARTRPLRDFFLTLFFVALGANINLSNFQATLLPALVFSLWVIGGHALVVMVVLARLGYRKRTFFMAGITTTQISEFSLVVMAMANRVGHIPDSLLGMVAIVGAVTMTLSTYLITYADTLFERSKRFLKILETKHSLENTLPTNPFANHLVMIGHNRTGQAVLPALLKLEMPIVVVDFNPDVVEQLKANNIEAVYGDIGDEELYDILNLPQAVAVVSTASDVKDNLQVVSYLTKNKKRPLLILSAMDSYEAEQLYKAGADYVLVPHHVGGEYLAHFFNHHGLDTSYVKTAGQQHRAKLKVV